jgi:hypothetical protein
MGKWIVRRLAVGCRTDVQQEAIEKTTGLECTKSSEPELWQMREQNLSAPSG